MTAKILKIINEIQQNCLGSNEEKFRMKKRRQQTTFTACLYGAFSYNFFLNFMLKQFKVRYSFIYLFVIGYSVRFFFANIGEIGAYPITDYYCHSEVKNYKR